MRRLAWLLIFVMVFSLLAVGCGKQQSQEEPLQQVEQKEQQESIEEQPKSGGKDVPPLSPPVKVTVGLKQVVSDAGVLIGVAKGYYEELGIEVEQVQFNTGQDMINALGAGQLDVGCTVSASGLFNAMLRGIPIKVVADKGINVPGQG